MKWILGFSCREGHNARICYPFSFAVCGATTLELNYRHVSGNQTDDDIVRGYEIPLGVAWSLGFRVVLTSCDNYCVVGFISAL